MALTIVKVSSATINKFIELFFRRLYRVFDSLEGGELHIIELPALLLDRADVFVLNDVTSLRIDLDRAARAFPFHALHGRDERIAIRLSAGLLQRCVDQVHPIIAADRHEVRAEMVGLL